MYLVNQTSLIIIVGTDRRCVFPPWFVFPRYPRPEFDSRYCWLTNRPKREHILEQSYSGMYHISTKQWGLMSRVLKFAFRVRRALCSHKLSMTPCIIILKAERAPFQRIKNNETMHGYPSVLFSTSTRSSFTWLDGYDGISAIEIKELIIECGIALGSLEAELSSRQEPSDPQKAAQKSKILESCCSCITQYCQGHPLTDSSPISYWDLLS